MSVPLFLDSSFLIAVQAENDQYHEQASRYWQSSLAPAGTPLVTTTGILMEVVAFFQGRSRHDRAMKVGHLLRHGDLIEMVSVSDELLEDGWRRLAMHPDKSFTLVDCLSFAVMEARGIQAALTFDHHFHQAEFRTLPNPALR